jgi:hypothetical protein
LLGCRYIKGKYTAAVEYGDDNKTGGATILLEMKLATQRLVENAVEVLR